MTATIETYHVETGPYDPDLMAQSTVVVTDWTGPAHVRPRPTSQRVVESAGDVATLRTYDLWVEPDAYVPEAGTNSHMLRVTDSADPSLIGVRFNVVDSPHDDWQTARRVVCQTVA